MSVFEWLAQYFEYATVELGQLVEKEYSVMRQADFARLWSTSSAYHRHLRYGVMRTAERTHGYER